MYNLVESRISKPVVCVLTSELCILGCDENLARYSWIEPLQASWSPLAAQYKADSVLLERTFGRSDKIAGRIAILYTVLAQWGITILYFHRSGLLAGTVTFRVNMYYYVKY